MRYLKYIIFVLSVFCIIDTSMAEPAAKIKYLMNEPVTLFDWGIYRLDKYFEDVHIEGAQSTILWTSYDWDKNILTLNFTVETNTKSRDEAKKIGKSLIDMVRVSLGVDPDNGKPYAGNSRLYTQHFSHSSAQDDSKPKGLESELDNITVIEVLVVAGDYQRGLKCKAPLLGTKIMFEE
jgi:hypothetical protein